MFKKYDSYKDSWIDWVESIPQNFNICRIKDILKWAIYWIWESSSSEWNIEVLWMWDINEWIISYPKKSFVNYVSNYFLLRKNDLLYTRTNWSIDLIWKVWLIEDNVENVSFASYLVRLRLKNNESWKFYNYFLNSFLFREKAKSVSISTAQNNLSSSKYLQLLIPRINFYEQNNIVNYLDENTLKIDKTIELLESKKSNYIELKQRVIFEAVTKWLNKDSFKDSWINWVWNMPENWSKDRLKNIFNERSVRNLDKQTWEPITTNILSVMKDIWVINHRDKWLVWNKMSEDITWYKIVHPNDIVVNKMNVIIWSVWISKEFWALSVVYIILITKADCSPRYYDYVFRVKAFQKSLRKIATWILEIREAVDMNLFKWLELPKPPKEEQIEIANYLDEKTSKIDEIVKTIDENIDRLKEYRKVLINDTVTGKIKVI